MKAEVSATFRKLRVFIAAQKSRMGTGGQRFAQMMLMEIDEHLAPKTVRMMPPIDDDFVHKALLDFNGLVVPGAQVERNDAANREMS